MKFLIPFLFLFGCANPLKPPLPRHPAPPNAALFPVSVKYGINTDTKNKNNVSADQLNKVLRGRLKGEGKTFIKYAQMYNVDATFAAAVAMAESGGASRLARQNNFFGLFRKGRALSFSSKEAGIKGFFERISLTYHKNGRYTVKQIQRVYCPVGGEWLKNVTKIANQVYGFYN